MKVLRTLVWLMLMLSATAFAAGSGKDKQVDVDTVDVPEKMVIQPTPEEIHDESSLLRTCGSCHINSDLDAEPKPLDHFQTTKDCGACHLSKSWLPLRFYLHLTGKYHPNATPQDCLTCHTTNSEFHAR